jgi:hypothetical protein
MFALGWSREPSDRMGHILLAIPERRPALARTLRTITRVLCTRPARVGESRGGNRRVWFVGNLLITYTVDDARKIVQIRYVVLANLR